MSYENVLKYASAHIGSQFGGSPAQDEPFKPQEEEFVLDPSVTLKKDDLLDYKYLNPIRDYMVARKGVDYKSLDDQEVVDDFVEHMRWFNANSVSTAGELGFINRADDMKKNKARKAYEIYDQLGNVFVNDGVAGAVSGIGDYVFAAAVDPTNYTGFITGGIARFGAAGAQLGGKEAIKAAVRTAGLKAAQGGAGRAAAAEAAKQAGLKAAQMALDKGMSKAVADKAYQEVAKKTALAARKGFAEDAMYKAQQGLFEDVGKRALKQTLVIDAGFAMMQDNMAQNTLIQAGAQEEYSAMQTSMSALLGGVAGGAQLFGRTAGKKFGSGLERQETNLEKLADGIVEEYGVKFSKEETEKAKGIILKEVEDWNVKVERGGELGQGLMPAELVRNIMLGSDGKGGLAKIYKDKGIKVGREKHLSDLMTNITRFMPDEDLALINKELAKNAGIDLGSLAYSRINLGDMVSKRINEAGKTLNVMSQVRKTLDAGIAAGSNKITNQLDQIEEMDEAAKKAIERGMKARKYAWGQSIWKRMLVSSPATTALNVQGYGVFAAGQTLADMFNGTAYMTVAAAKATYDPKAAAEMARVGRAYFSTIGTRARMLLDPFTTHDAYMRFLKDNEDIQKVLMETTSGIVGKGARFGMDPESKTFKVGEYVANAANTLTGVSIQDSFTKSQMFMAELDKYLRIEKKMSLKEAMMLDENVIDEKVLGGALDTTLKSVFSKDYTRLTSGDAPGGEILSSMAGMVESISNKPGVGMLLPFGRFMNNVVGTAIQWSPLATPQLMQRFYKGVIKKEGWDVSDNEILARMMVGTGGLITAMQMDEERRAKGLGVYELDGGAGTIIDAKNIYPLSAMLAVGRAANLKRNGEELPPELQTEALLQLGVGQIAKDTQFGNDLINAFDSIANIDEGDRGFSFDAIYKVGGNILAGFTRPLDAVNKIVGFASGTDTAKDIRQTEGVGVLTQSATKYVDNLFEIFDDKIDGITGEQLRVATREGEVYDENPFAKVFGLTLKQGRTATEKAYSMAEMQSWTASERTKIPTYDKAFNVMIAPHLERATQRLIDSDNFKKADLKKQRRMLKEVLGNVRSQIGDAMLRGFGGDENAQLRLVLKAKRIHNKEVRSEAKRIMKQKYGVDVDIEDMSYRELDTFMQIADSVNDVYDEVGKLYGRA